MLSRRAYIPAPIPPKRPKRTIISDVEPVWHIVVFVGFFVRVLLGTFGTPFLGRSDTGVSRYRMRCRVRAMVAVYSINHAGLRDPRPAHCRFKPVWFGR
jgi:hypothetical protein